MPSVKPPHNATHRTVKALHSASQEKGIHETTIAELSGVNREQLRRWRYGEYSPRVDELEAALNVLGLMIIAVPITSSLIQE